MDALHERHELVLIDLDHDRLAALRERYDVRTVEGDGTTREILRQAGVETADLLIACSPRDEVNLVCAMLVKRLSSAQVIVRTSSAAYLDAWREREIDVDFMVSSELETANAISAIIGIPAARQTDVFAEGKVQIVEFDVPPRRVNDALIGRPLRDAAIPADSKVAGIIRGERMIVPRGDGGDHAGRPRRRDRVARGGARMERRHRQGRAAGRRHGRVRRGADGDDDRGAC